MIRDENNEVDTVSAGLVIIIIGLLLVQFAPILSDLSYTPRKITGYEDKTTRIPDYIAPQVFIVLGIFTSIIGCAVLLKNIINQLFESLIQARNEDNFNRNNGNLQDHGGNTHKSF